MTAGLEEKTGIEEETEEPNFYVRGGAGYSSADSQENGHIES